MLNYQAEWEEVRVSHSVISDSLRSHGLWPTRLLCPWNSPGNSSGVDSHFMPSFCSVTQSCPTLFAPMDCGTPGSPVLHCLLELAQTHVHRVSDAIQTSHPAIPFSSCPQSFPCHGLFQWVGSLHQVAKITQIMVYNWSLWHHSEKTDIKNTEASQMKDICFVSYYILFIILVKQL